MTDLQRLSSDRPERRISVCLILAISYTCFRLIVPTVSCPGLLAPFLLPFLLNGASTALSRSHEVCGVRTSKWNDRSGRTVTRHGVGVPATRFAVLALNSYRKRKLPIHGSFLAIANCCKSLHRPQWRRRWRCVDSYLAKVHRLDTLTTQRGTNRRTRTGLPSSYDELDDLVDAAGTSFGHGGGTCGLVTLVMSVVKRCKGRATSFPFYCGPCEVLPLQRERRHW